MEVPELSHITALVKGDLLVNCWRRSLNFEICLELCFLEQKRASRRRTQRRQLEPLFPWITERQVASPYFFFLELSPWLPVASRVGICQLRLAESCTPAGDAERPRRWQRAVSQDLGSSDQCHSLQWSRRFSTASQILRIASLGRWPFPCVCVADLNCLTMTFKESPAKSKHSNVVSSGARLLFLTAVVEANRIISFYFDPVRSQKFGPGTSESAP